MKTIIFLFITITMLSGAEPNIIGNERIQQLINAGKTEEASKIAELMLSENPDPRVNGFAYLIVMNGLLQNNETDRLIKMYMGIKDRLREIPPPQQSMINIVMAEMHYKKKEFDASLVFCQKSIQAQNDNPFAHNQLAWLYATGKAQINTDTALASAQKACELTKYKLPGLVDTLAAVYARRGDFNSAKTYLQLALADANDEHKAIINKHLDLLNNNKTIDE